MKDKQLWETARLRASFKKSVLTYFLVNTFLVAIWYFTNGERANGHFWPIWPILGWGIGIGLQYLNAYHGNRLFSAEKEYEQLKSKY